jgi:hypothetical protein
MAEPAFTVRVEREDGDTLLLDGLALARAFFTGDPSSQPRAFDSLAGKANPDRIVVDDINAINATMRARSAHALWKAILDGNQAWLRDIPLDLDIVQADEAEWNASNGDALLSAAIAACIYPGIGLASATKVLHLKRPRLVPILDRLVAEMMGFNPPDSPSIAVGQQLTAAIRREGRRNHRVLGRIQAELAMHDLERPLIRVFDAIVWYSHPAASITGVKRSISVRLHA